MTGFSIGSPSLLKTNSRSHTCGTAQVLVLQEVPHGIAHNRLAELRTDQNVRERLLANDLCLFAFDGRSDQSCAHARDLLIAYSDQLQHQMPAALVSLRAEAGLAEAIQTQVCVVAQSAPDSCFMPVQSMAPS